MALRLSAKSPNKMHHSAKKLNNSAASYIELGQYNKAIKRLKKALHLIKQSSSTDNSATSETTTCCNYCSLNESMVYSEENTPFDLLDNDIMDTAEPTNVSITSFLANKQRADDNRSDNSYIHQRPVYITPRCLIEGYNLGPFLPLLVLFNLALAHHLKFVSISTLSMNFNTATTNSTRMRILALRKVLRLYELTYNLLIEISANERHQFDDALCSNTNNTNLNTYTYTSASIADPGLRFSIIICNNLSQVFKTLQNQEKHKECLRKLLSMLMYVVDLERKFNISNFDEEEYSQVASLSSSSPSSPLAMTNSLPWSRRKWLFMDLDGFLQNTIPIILQDNYAMVA